jgi:hypothetical protein
MFGMTVTELKLWMVDLMDRHTLPRIRTWQRRQKVRFDHNNSARRRPGEFVCDRHWSQIEATFGTDDPIHAGSVMIGLTTALYLSGQYPEPKPIRHACCKLNDVGWQGILARSRPSFFNEEAQSGRRQGEGRAAVR